MIIVVAVTVIILDAFSWKLYCLLIWMNISLTKVSAVDGRWMDICVTKESTVDSRWRNVCVTKESTVDSRWRNVCVTP